MVSVEYFKKLSPRLQQMRDTDIARFSYLCAWLGFNVQILRKQLNRKLFKSTTKLENLNRQMLQNDILDDVAHRNVKHVLELLVAEFGDARNTVNFTEENHRIILCHAARCLEETPYYDDPWDDEPGTCAEIDVWNALHADPLHTETFIPESIESDPWTSTLV